MADDPKEPKEPDPDKEPEKDPPKEPDYKAEAEKWKAQARKHEARSKENAQAAQELQQLKDAEKSEVDKAKDTATAAEQRATEAERKALQIEVALDKAPEGMPLAQVRKLAKRLSGGTQEELETDAEELFADFKPDTGDDGGDTPRRPKERLKTKPGAAPEAEPDDNDPAKLAAGVSRDW